MKLIFCILIIALLACTNSVQRPSVNQPAGQSVVELFTSEGCSSCPPADKLLAEINGQYSDSNVLLLAYHVDYWNRYGWKDSFSTKTNTERQNYYARVFHLSSIYTPQVVVNGEKEFVGSDRKNLVNALSSYGKPSAALSLEISEKDQDRIVVSVDNVHAESSESVVVLLVQSKAITKVKRGENAGKELSHINIVREFSVLSGKMHTAVFHCAEKERKNFFVAAFMQNTILGKINGFATRPLMLN